MARRGGRHGSGLSCQLCHSMPAVNFCNSLRIVQVDDARASGCRRLLLIHVLVQLWLAVTVPRAGDARAHLHGALGCLWPLRPDHDVENARVTEQRKRAVNVRVNVGLHPDDDLVGLLLMVSCARTPGSMSVVVNVLTGSKSSGVMMR